MLVNRGTANGSARIKVYVNSYEESSYYVAVDGGSSIPMQFSISRSQPGTYSVVVGSVQAGSFRVEESIDPDLVFFISSVLMFTALVMGIIYIRRKQQGYY